MELNEVTCLKQQQSNTLVLNVTMLIWLVSSLPSVFASLIVAQSSSFHTSWKNWCTIGQEIWSLVLVVWDCNRFHGLPSKSSTSCLKEGEHEDPCGAPHWHGLWWREVSPQRLSGAAAFCWLVSGVLNHPNHGGVGNKNPKDHLKHLRVERSIVLNVFFMFFLQEQAWESSYGPCLVRSFLTAKDFQKLGETRTIQGFWLWPMAKWWYLQWISKILRMILKETWDSSFQKRLALTCGFWWCVFFVSCRKTIPRRNPGLLFKENVSLN